MKRKRICNPPPRSTISAATAIKVFLLFGVLAAFTFVPGHAITISKVNVQNVTGRASHTQRVVVYGLQPLLQSSAASAYTTKPYTVFTTAPYPYATSTNTQALYGLSGRIRRNEYATSTLSTFNPASALSVSSWSWYNQDEWVGSVPDPSISRRKGPTKKNTDDQTWVSLDITLANTAKPTRDINGNLVEVLERPTATLSYPDFSVGLRRTIDGGLLNRLGQVKIEENLSIQATTKINPSSSGALATSSALSRNCNNDPLPTDPDIAKCWVELNNGQSCASDGDPLNPFDGTTTNPVTPRVIPLNDPSLIPTMAQPTTAVVLSTTEGVDGVDPLDPNSSTPPRITSSFNRLVRVSLTPGASITFRVRVLVGAAHILTDPGGEFTFLFLARMREVSVVNGVELTHALFSAVADYPEAINICEGATDAPPVTGLAAMDRQQWAHVLKLYNRTLGAFGDLTGNNLRNGDF